jgi:hypothetical protein
MQIIGADRRTWRVGRRWLAWRTRPHRLLGEKEHLLTGGDDPVSFAIGVVSLVVLLPFMVWWVLSWTLALCLTPAVLLWRVLGGRGWTVVAYPLGSRVEYRRSGVSWAEAGRLAESAKREIADRGLPASLDPPVTG